MENRDKLQSRLDVMQEEVVKMQELLKQCDDANTILVGGLRWSLVNMGTDIENPYGKYYTFEEAQEQCPKGWRIPTIEEYKTFIEKTTHEWIKQDGINGTLFTDKENGNEIFFPAVGYRDWNTSVINNPGENGYSWSSTRESSSSTSARSLNWYDTGVASWGNSNISYGFTVRCVK